MTGINRLAALTIDVESFAQTPAVRSATGTLEDRSVGLDGVDTFRETAARHDATTTAFVVSELLDNHSEPIEALSDAGHEIASHTHTHRLLGDLSPAERNEEIRQSRDWLESVTDDPIEGFRAPAFDFGGDHFDALAEAGYAYDASVAPCRSIPGWYGGEYDVRRPVPATEIDPDAPPGLAEVPIAVMPGLGLPLTGTWLRFFGVRYTLLGMELLARRGVAPVLYVHPWELVDLPQIAGVPRRVYVRTGAWMRRAVDRILAADFEFVPIRELAESAANGAE